MKTAIFIASMLIAIPALAADRPCKVVFGDPNGSFIETTSATGVYVESLSHPEDISQGTTVTFKGDCSGVEITGSGKYGEPSSTHR